MKMLEPHRFSRVASGFSNYDGDFRLPLVLALGSPIFNSSCEGKLGVVLESLQGQRDLIEACVQDLIFLSREDRDLGLPFQTPSGTQPSSCMRLGAQGWCTGMTLRHGMGWEVGGGIQDGEPMDTQG